MPKFRVDYNYYTDVKYDTLFVEASDLNQALSLAEDQMDALDLINPMIDTIEEIKS